MKTPVWRAIAVGLCLTLFGAGGSLSAGANPVLGSEQSLARGGPVAGSCYDLTRAMPAIGTNTFGAALMGWEGQLPEIVAGSSCVYQWLRDGVPIPGATKGFYTVGVEDDGTILSLRVVIKLPGGVPQAFTSKERRVTFLGWRQFVLSPSLIGSQSGDFLGVSMSGDLWINHGIMDTPTGKSGYPILMGVQRGSKVYGPGDWDHDGRNDVISVDPSTGKMFLHRGLAPEMRNKTLQARLAPKRQIGQGWVGFTVIPAGDLDGDGFVDLLAVRQSTGELFLYAGDGKGGFKYPYPKVGYGWKGYDLYAAGDLNGDGQADILSINKAGDLFMYAGKGDGTFAKKIQVGNGWKGHDLAAGADLNGDGLADIVSRGPDDELYFYAGKGGGYFAKKVKM